MSRRPPPRALMCALGASLLTVACAGAPPSPARPSPSTPDVASDEVAASSPAPTTTHEAASSDAPSSPPVEAATVAAEPAHASDPPGAKPLTQAERDEVEAKCRRVAAHARAIARADRAQSSLRSYLEEVEAKPPTIATEDVPRCLDLMLRSAVAQEAREAESVAINRLRTMIVGLSGAVARTGALCPSTPPVPLKLSSVRDEPIVVEGPAWEAPGWKCLGFDLHQAPQRFQYQLATDADAGTYELVARGYPVRGQPPVELVLAGEMKDGAVEPHSNVMRRPAR